MRLVAWPASEPWIQSQKVNARFCAFKAYFPCAVTEKTVYESGFYWANVSGAFGNVFQKETRMADLDFAALLCSRLCHDLVSPVGAINNGLEILEEETDASMRDAVFDLINKSTQQTANKLQFFRLAFGAGGGFSAQLDLREVEKAVRALLDGSRVELDWQVSELSGSKSLVKLLLNVCLICSEALIRGGTLRVGLEKTGDEFALEVESSGQRIIIQNAVIDGLQGKLSMTDLDPRNVPAHLASCVAAELGSTLTVDLKGETNLTVKALINSTN